MIFYHDNDKIDFARTVNVSDFEFAISEIYTNQNINRNKESFKLFKSDLANPHPNPWLWLTVKGFGTGQRCLRTKSKVSRNLITA